jgi:hypothetical protein
MGGPLPIRERRSADQQDSWSARSQSAERTQGHRSYVGATHVAGRSLTGEEARPEPEGPHRRGLVHNFASIPVSTPGPSGHQQSGLWAAAPLPASSGRRLEGGISTDMQARFGAAAADVVIHTDPGAAAAADRLQASAFTLGNHVAFGAGQFDPASTKGRMLLAHEVAHVAQQRGANQTPNLARPATAHSSPERELEANEAAANVILGLPVPSPTAGPLAVARQGKDEESDWRKRLWDKAAALVAKNKAEARDFIKEKVGAAEGVVTEAANLVDVVIWSEYAPGDIANIAVDKMASAAGLPKDKREALHEAVQTVTTNPVLQEVRALAKKADLADPTTGAPSTARAVSRAFDWVEKKSDETLFRGLPQEEGLLSKRDIGVLEGAIGTQVGLAFIDVEEVQLALKALGAIGSVESVVAVIQSDPDNWQNNPKFWFQVINLALYMIGIGASATGKKIAAILADAGGTLLTTLSPAIQLADDYMHATGPDRDQRLREDLKALVKAVAQAIQQIIMHAKGAKKGPSGTPEGSTASSQPATGREVAAQVPEPAKTVAAPVPEPAKTAAAPVGPAPVPGPAEPAPVAATGPAAAPTAKVQQPPLEGYYGGGEGIRKGIKTTPMPEVEAAPPGKRAKPGITVTEAERTMQAEAEQASSRLGKPLQVKTKAAAEEGDVARSGYGAGGGGAALTKQVLDIGKEIGHDFAKNSSLDAGVPGQSAASHAEKLAAVSNPGKALAVDRVMCPDCVAFFQKYAQARNVTVVIHEPGQTWVFRPDGVRVGLSPSVQVELRSGGASAEPVSASGS